MAVSEERERHTQTQSTRACVYVSDCSVRTLGNGSSSGVSILFVGSREVAEGSRVHVFVSWRLSAVCVFGGNGVLWGRCAAVGEGHRRNGTDKKTLTTSRTSGSWRPAQA